jgi:Tol biopolymer transport system component
VESGAAVQDSSPIVVRRVWYNPGGLDFWGGPSPEGDFLTFTAWEGDPGGALAVHYLGTGEDRPVTPPTEPGDYSEYSRVSPDGKQVAYLWWSEAREYELRLIGVDGSEPRVLHYEAGSQIQPREWSSDGESILVLIVDNQDNRLGVISTKDGSFRVLKTLGLEAPFEISISPDGRYVIYDSPGDGDHQRDVFVITVSSGEERKLISHPAEDLVLGWTPDGGHVLFASDRSGTLGAWLLPVENGLPAGAPRLVKPDLWNAYPLGFARTGAYFYGISIAMRDVYVATLDLETGQLLDRPSRLSESYFGSNGAPEWSFDGKSVVFLSGRKPWSFPGGVIVIRSMETGDVRELEPSLGSVMWPRWFPDGRSILVRGQDDTGRGFFGVDVQTGEVEAVIRFPSGSPNYATRPEWIRDGTELLYWWPDEEGTTFHAHNLETGRDRILYRTESSGAEGRLYPRLAVSPDQRRIAFVLRTEEKSTLMVMPVEGGGPKAILSRDLDEPPVELQWGPDGRHLYYVDGQGQGLWRVSPEGGEPERLDWFEQVRGVGFFRFQPGGQRVALMCAEGEGGSEVWVMEDFLPAPDRIERERRVP